MLCLCSAISLHVLVPADLRAEAIREAQEAKRREEQGSDDDDDDMKS